jgi:integrase
MDGGNQINTKDAARWIKRRLPRDGKLSDVFSDPRTPTLKLRVTAAGSRTWFIWTTRRVKGRRKTVTLKLGDANTMSIDEARDACRGRCHELVEDAIDAPLSVDATAFECAQYYLNKRPRSATLRAATRRGYELYANKYWGDARDAPLRTLSSAILTRLYAERAARSVSDANNAFGFLRAVWRYWARITKYRGDDPFADVVEDWGEKNTDAGNPMSDAALAALQPRLQQWRGSPLYPLLVYWLLLTGCRVGESLQLTWDLVEDDVVLLDRETTKMDRMHAVPITPALRALVIEPLKKARPYYNSEFLFPSERRDGHMKVSKPLRVVLHRLPDGPYRVHDSRHTVATIAAELGHDDVAIKAVLSHTSKSGATAETKRYAKVRAQRRAAILIEVQDAVLAKMGVVMPWSN